MSRFRFRLFLIPIVVIGLLTLAAVLLAPYADTRLAGVLDNLFTNGLSLKAERLEVDLLGRRAWAYNLHATHPSAPVLSVEEIRLEGVNLYALVFGVQDAHLADRFLVRGAVPPKSFETGNDRFALELGEAFELSGPFPGLLSLLRAPHGRAFGPAALRMRAKVLSLDKPYLGTPDLQVEAENFIGTDFSLSGQTSLVLHNFVCKSGPELLFIESGVMGRRATPDPVAFMSGRSEDVEAERTRVLASGMRLEGLILHKAGVTQGPSGLQAALLTADAFSGVDSGRLGVSMKGLKDLTRDEPWRPLAMADGNLAADLLLEAEDAGGGIRQRLKLRLENPKQARLLDFIQLHWEQENPRQESPRSFFPAWEQPGPMLVGADFEVSHRRGVFDVLERGRPAAGDPDAGYAEGALYAASELRKEFPDVLTGRHEAQLDEFLLRGGKLRLQAEPSEPLPVVLLLDTLRENPPSLGWKRSLNGVEAR